MNTKLIYNISFFCLINLLFFACTTDKKDNHSTNSTKTLDTAYMSNEEWKEYQKNRSHVSDMITITESSQCSPLELSELLELFEYPKRHDWLTNREFKLIETLNTGNTGNAAEDITQYTNFRYQKCRIDNKQVEFNKDGGEFTFNVKPLSNLSYSINYRDYVVANKQFNVLSEEYKKRYKEVIYEPTKNEKNSRQIIFYVDGIFIFFSNGQNGNKITLSKEPATFVGGWKKHWRAGLYKIEGDPYKVEPFVNTVPETISGKDVHKYMSTNENAIIIDLRTYQERTKGVPHFEGRVLHLIYGSDFKYKVGDLDKSKQYLLLSQTGNSEEAHQYIKDIDLTNFTRIEGGFKAMFGQLFDE